jgi:phosphoglycolate phosphatase
MHNRRRPIKRLIVLDFDNTLFDWVSLWHRCFSAMMSKVTELTGIPAESLYSDIRAIHQRHRTAEYAFLLSAIPQLQEFVDSGTVESKFGPAIQAFRDERKRSLQLYGGVAETLLRIKGAGTKIAIYTESLSYYSFYRLKRLGLDGVVDSLYTPPDHEIPSDVASERHYRGDFYALEFTKHRHTPLGELKPNPDILQQIVRSYGLDGSDVVYVGDSRHKDIAMAQDAGIECAWAKYGEAQESPAYELLKKVTHWTDDDVARETEVRRRPVTANIILDKGLEQIFEYFSFGEFTNGRH